MILIYQTCKAEYHSLSGQRITLVPMALMQYLQLALTTCDILPYRLDNIIVLVYCTQSGNLALHGSSTQLISMGPVIILKSNKWYEVTMM